ncbi:similar to Saccharomyces cerevisiae YKL078W DHR2 Predominantly nucleolar DEAH-box ATP-dependent RNA helicase, required for 18S rRNA synthesis [Maudiozyma saulgeensis]|uniref:RNA helicase n=1 Tax=Maudiozyma saulgeensis TaxID=1789683 RepID=A0A1X7QWH1_9SACH|nr:similar to Saccharomyces cerevisiae YKL078W DHR2 Predominantly nucleolar DEAH-box ATP-dependent RNA helicase, required for 18S rRNA synthesis [Kazachstania saulgeensis]
MTSISNKSTSKEKRMRSKVHPFRRNQKGGNGKVEVKFHDSNEDEDNDVATHEVHDKHDLKIKAKRLLEVRQTLPVYQNKELIMKNLIQNPVTLLIGETGSGKSTQIPQFLLDHLYSTKQHGSIAVTQPRRVAAINLATRVASEHGCNVGQQIGYSVRFDNTTSAKTRLKYLTDGMLLRELMMNKTLKEYSVIIIDEAHERTVLTDLILGFLKALIEGPRPDLKIIVMSATLQAERFSAFFNNAPVIFVEGRKFDVSQYYLTAPSDDIVDSVIRTVVQLNQGEPLGDILCFLPGQEEIDKAVIIMEKISAIIHKENSVPLMIPLPLYAALPPAKQSAVFAPIKGFKRKIIFSTNIAETSVTVSGVKYVVDSGLRKVKVWRHQLGLATLLTVPISQASAEQRSGRAGRESEGKCYRLFCEKDFDKLPPQTEPEIARSDITSPVLMLKRYGVKDIVNWTWFEYPGKEALVMALQELYQLGALDDFGNITKKGEQMALLPVQPHLSSVLIQANESNCIEDVIDIVSCLSVENLLMNPLPEQRDEVNERRLMLCNGGKKYGDLIMMKELFDVYFYELGKGSSSASERQAWCKELCLSYRGFKNVVKIRNQLRMYCMRLFQSKWLNGSEEGDELGESIGQNNEQISKVLKCFLVGFAKNTAIGMPDRSYRTVTTGEAISVHPSSMLFLNKSCPSIMYVEYVFTTKGYARNVSRIELEWLQDVIINGTAVTKEKASL